MIKTIEFQSSALLPALSLAGKVISNKSPMPILETFRIEAEENNTLSITASDGETWLTMIAQVTCVPKGLVFCIDAKSLLQVVSNLNNKEIVAEIDEAKKTITFRYDKGHCQLPYQDAAVYPKPKEMEWQEAKSIPTKILYDSIGRASFAVANEELRQVMNGVHFDFLEDGDVISVATDARKLVRMRHYAVTSAPSEAKSFTLPTKPCNILLGLLQKVSDNSKESIVNYATDEKNVKFVTDTFVVVSRLVEGRYPNYNAVIPQESSKRAVINKEEFVSALKHVLPMSSQQTQLIALRFATVITTGVDVIAQDVDFSRTAQEHVECEYTGDDVTIGFNGSSLLQLVQNIATEKIIIELEDSHRAGVIKESADNREYDYTSIIMPMLVNV